MKGPQKEKYDVVIIGAGLSGLSAGIRLSQFFGNVVILESHAIAGGLNSYYERGKPRQLFSSGLHTVTNAQVSGRKWGLGLISRNLGIKPEEFEIYAPDCGSRISTPEVSLKFSNDAELLRSEIGQAFPDQMDAYDAFNDAVIRKTMEPGAAKESALEFLGGFFSSEELVHALALPVFTYAGYAEGDLDLRTYALLYRSIFIDGCGSPVDMKQFLDKLINVYLENGGEICYRAKVEEVLHSEGNVDGVLLKDGREIKAKYVLSSAGLYETGQMASSKMGQPGDVSIFQVAASYDSNLVTLGVPDSVHFLSRQDDFCWRFRNERDALSVITFSAQDSYGFDAEKHQFKISCFDHFASWEGLSAEAYKAKKKERAEKLFEVAFKIYPGLANHTPIMSDSFSPLTIKKYTSHPNGTLYGGAIKSFDGTTGIENLYVIGNDQGGIGIMGALTSGVLISNYNILINQR